MNDRIFTFPDAIDWVDARGPYTASTVVGDKIVTKWRKMTPYVLVSEVTGTAPTLDINIEALYDNTWIVIYSFPQITAVGNYRQAPIEIVENRIRFSITIGGTTPSFTIILGAIYKS